MLARLVECFGTTLLTGLNPWLPAAGPDQVSVAGKGLLVLFVTAAQVFLSRIACCIWVKVLAAVTIVIRLQNYGSVLAIANMFFPLHGLGFFFHIPSWSQWNTIYDRVFGNTLSVWMVNSDSLTCSVLYYSTNQLSILVFLSHFNRLYQLGSLRCRFVMHRAHTISCFCTYKHKTRNKLSTILCFITAPLTVFLTSVSHRILWDSDGGLWTFWGFKGMLKF